MLLKYLVLVLCLLGFPPAFAQADSTHCTTVGFEVDALPFLTGGYYGSIWLGHNHFRYRAIITKATTPDFFLPKGFTNNKLMVYTVIADYFFAPHFEKWWIGAGAELWQEKIQTDAKRQTTSFTSTIATVGGGYVWKFYRNFYLNPWAGLHLRLGGTNQVIVDEKIFKPALLTPEASIKLGWHF